MNTLNIIISLLLVTLVPFYFFKKRKRDRDLHEKLTLLSDNFDSLLENIVSNNKDRNSAFSVGHKKFEIYTKDQGGLGYIEENKHYHINFLYEEGGKRILGGVSHQPFILMNNQVEASETELEFLRNYQIRYTKDLVHEKMTNLGVSKSTFKTNKYTVNK